MKNRLDKITDKLKTRIGRITLNAQNQFKGVNPYRQEPVSNKERLLKYSEFTPDVEMRSRQDFGDAPVDNYKQKMEQLLAKEQTNAR